MKTIQSIIIAAAAIFLVASCDDDSMNIEKTRIFDNGNYGLVSVSFEDSRFRLSWSQPIMSTQNGYQAIAYDGNSLSYDVYVVDANKPTPMALVKTVDSCGAELSVAEVEAVLKTIDEYTVRFEFCVCIAGTNVPICYSTAQWLNMNKIDRRFTDYNIWNTDVRDIGSVQDYVAVIESKNNGNYWDNQFCIAFRGLQNQTKGNNFELSFEVMWEGDNVNDKSALFTVYTGKYLWNSVKNEEYEDYRDQWDFNINTQLVLGYDDSWMFKSYEVTGSWQTFKFGGKIGDMGADIIGIEINLSGYDGGGNDVAASLNHDGTFYFRNITVEIEKDTAASYFMDKESVGAKVLAKADGSGEVFGGGYYAYGETALLTAVALPGSVFTGWSDGSTENPRKLFVDGDVELVAKFSIYMTPLQFKSTDFYFNKWITDGDFASSPLETQRVDDDNLAYAIEVSSAGDEWTAQFFNVIHGNQGQEVGNKFTFDCDVYWERASDNSNDTADIHLLTGKMGYHAVHDDWQWSPEDNTELITNNEGGFWGYVHNQPRKIPNKKWTHVSWGDELIIGEKGADYIGIQMNLTNTAGTNNGTFYFRNIEIRMGNYNYIFEY